MRVQLIQFFMSSVQARIVLSTWGSRCDKILFITDKKEEDIMLPVIAVNITGRSYLWGKTKQGISKAFLEHGKDIDWVLKVINLQELVINIFLLGFQADHDTYVIMENLRNLLSHYNASKPLLAGGLFICRQQLIPTFHHKNG